MRMSDQAAIYIGLQPPSHRVTASNLTMRMSDQAVGSAVAYFNQTYRAKKLLTAWAEAMMYGTNGRAPDDQVLGTLLNYGGWIPNSNPNPNQVLDTLLNYGGWIARCSLGWLPASYLRLMPAFFRGVVPVIEHDHGSAPGINGGHSETKPKYPPVKDMELCQPDAEENKGLARYVSEIEAEAEARALKEAEEMCFLHGQCDDAAKTATAPTAPTAPLASPSPSPASSPVPPEAPVGAPARTPVPYPSASPSPSPVAAEPPVARTPVPAPSPGRFRMSRRYQRMSQLDA